MYFVYVLYNKKHKRSYVGVTTDLVRRLTEHNSHGQKAARSTAAFDGEWSLVYSEEAATRSDALRREYFLKTYQGRKLVRSKILCLEDTAALG